jgi:cell division protein FtsI (penicillin-binding protein 3)
MAKILSYQAKRRPRRIDTNNDSIKSTQSNNNRVRKTNNTKSQTLSRSRLILVWLVLIGGVLGLGWRLYQLQIVQGSELRKRAEQQHSLNLKPYIPRRPITDAGKNVLATDRLIYTLFVHPDLFTQTDNEGEKRKKRKEVAEKLATILENVSKESLINKFNKQKTGIRLVSQLSEEKAAKIKKLGLDGVELIQHYARFYPQQETVSEIVGYVNIDHIGQAGVEYSQQEFLERPVSEFVIKQARNGMILPADIPKELLHLDELQLQLTVDLRLQRAVRSALQKQIKHYQAKRGAVIVMDAQDGSLLALATQPTFNPNQYYKYDMELFKNWAVTDVYEPGSTFKPINVAIALEAGAIQPNTHVNDLGSVTIDGWPIYNASKVGYGYIDIAKVLQTSSNIGMIKIMTKMPKNDYYNYLKKLGLGEKVGTDLPGDTAGYLKGKREFTYGGIEVATASFGQGFSLNPLKLVQLHGAIANGGKLVTPHVVKGLLDSHGHFHWQPQYPSKTVFSPKTSQSVLEMMETVVSEGTGKPAGIPGYRIAGKTGTAQKAGPRGGYIPNAKITSFVAILPVNAPRYVVLAVIDEPKGANTFGSTVAAPIVKSVIESLISIKGIPPSK